MAWKGGLCHLLERLAGFLEGDPKCLRDGHSVKSVLTGRGPKTTVHLQGALGGKYLPSRFRVSTGTLVSKD